MLVSLSSLICVNSERPTSYRCGKIGLSSERPSRIPISFEKSTVISVI